MEAIKGSFSPQCHYYISTKEAHKPYANSLALHTQENPVDIIANREDLHLSPSPLHYIVANQVHSNRIEVICEKDSKGWLEEQSAISDCDGLITDQKGIVLTILTADCVPILLYDTKREVIGALHAGWKGTQLKIAQHAITIMQESFHSDPKDIHAYIAPAIGDCCYEVGSDVAQHFETDSFETKGEKFMLDLPYDNEKQLIQMGVAKEHIIQSRICTACEVDRFFSYRQEQGCSGRFMSMIWIEA